VCANNKSLELHFLFLKAAFSITQVFECVQTAASFLFLNHPGSAFLHTLQPETKSNQRDVTEWILVGEQPFLILDVAQVRVRFQRVHGSILQLRAGEPVLWVLREVEHVIRTLLLVLHVSCDDTVLRLETASGSIIKRPVRQHNKHTTNDSSENTDCY
jgi:hypothetical protein